MSVTRQVNLGNLDIDLMEEIADEMGLITVRNGSSRLWGSRVVHDCDLVVSTRNRNMDIGFKEKADGSYEAHYDHMEGDTYSELMGTYFERLAEKKSMGRFQTVSRTKVGNKVEIVLRRL